MSKAELKDPVELIRTAFNRKIPQGKHNWIRLSGIGHACDRYLYLQSKEDFSIDEARAVKDSVPAHIGNTLHLFYGYILSLIHI